MREAWVWDEHIQIIWRLISRVICRAHSVFRVRPCILRASACCVLPREVELEGILVFISVVYYLLNIYRTFKEKRKWVSWCQARHILIVPIPLNSINTPILIQTFSVRLIRCRHYREMLKNMSAKKIELAPLWRYRGKPAISEWLMRHNANAEDHQRK